MKKFIVFFVICVFLFVASLFVKEFDFSQYSNLKVQVFTSSKSVSKFDEVNYVENGDGQIIICDYDIYNQIRTTQNNISGVTFIFDGDEKLFESIVHKLCVRIIEKSNNSFVGYTNNFHSSQTVNGKKVNIQGYCDNGKIFIGTPLLLGSY